LEAEGRATRFFIGADRNDGALDSLDHLDRVGRGHVVVRRNETS